MSIFVNLHRLQPEAAVQLAKSPTTAREVLAKLATERTGADVDRLPAVLRMEEDWNIAHYLLTGRADGGQPPLCFIYNRVWGRQIGVLEGFLDPPVLYEVDQVKEIAHGLRGALLQRSALRKRFSPSTMARRQVYGVATDVEVDTAQEEVWFSAVANLLNEMLKFLEFAVERDEHLAVEYF